MRPFVLIILIVFGNLLIPLVFLSAPPEPVINKRTSHSGNQNGKNSALASPIIFFKQSLYNKQRENGGIKNSLKIDEKSEKFKSKLTTSEDYALGGVLLAFGTLSLFGNTCTLALFYQQNHLTPVELLFVHQAIIDLIFTLGTFPPPIIASFNHRWLFGHFGCNLFALAKYLHRSISVFSITSIAVLRYLKTYLTMDSGEINCSTCSKAISWSYLVALIWALTPLFGFGRYDVVPFGLDCDLSWIAEDQESRLQLVLSSIFGVFIPLSTILFCYFQIAKKVSGCKEECELKGLKSQNEKVTSGQLKLIGVVVAVGFAVTWVPITVIMLMASFSGEMVIPLKSTAIPALCAKLSPVLNPFINVFSTKRYRKVLFGMWGYTRNERKQGNEIMLEDFNSISK